MKKVMLVCVAIISLLLLAGCGSAPKSSDQAPPTTNQAQETTQPQETKSTGSPVDLRWGTIAAGGAWQVIGSAMLEDVKKANPGYTGSTIPSNPTSNIMGVHEGKFDIAFTLADTTSQAWNGEGYFKPSGKIDDIREIIAIYPHASHIVVWADSGINSVKDLKGKRVTPGPKGTSGDLEFQRLLKAYGMALNDVKLQYLSFEDAAQQMIDGHLDALFLFSPPPFAPVINVGSQRTIKLLPIDDDKIAELTKYQGIQPYEFPAGMYKGVDKPVKGIMARSHIIVNKNMPDDVAYNIVKAIAENYSRYPEVLASMKFAKLEEMGDDVGIPLHPGALKYYKEKGWVK